MEFSRSVFYQLRDIATIANTGRTHLRYSKSALELTYEYHTERVVPVRPIIRWTLAVLALSWGGLIWAKAGLLWGCIATSIPAFFLYVGRTNKELVLTGVVQLTYVAGEASFFFRNVEPTDGTSLPLGPELLLSTIRSFRVKTLFDYSSEETFEYGLVEVRHAASEDWLLFAELPTPRAASLLKNLLICLTESSTTIKVVPEARTWPSNAIYAVAKFCMQLLYGKNRPE
jgi:hypothetical protein